MRMVVVSRNCPSAAFYISVFSSLLSSILRVQNRGSAILGLNAHEGRHRVPVRDSSFNSCQFLKYSKHVGSLIYGSRIGENFHAFPHRRQLCFSVTFME